MNKGKGKRASEIKMIQIDRINILKSDIVITSQSVLKVYQREVDRKRLLTRKADVVNNRLLFITEALRQLLEEDSFKNLLRAEGLTTLPKPLAALMDEKGHLHG